MDSISFQNGFVCGLATKGLVKSGAIYEPEAYNDAGVYNFFYIDFKRVMEPFSIVLSRIANTIELHAFL